jgi:hypothetical protein
LTVTRDSPSSSAMPCCQAGSRNSADCHRAERDRSSAGPLAARRRSDLCWLCEHPRIPGWVFLSRRLSGSANVSPILGGRKVSPLAARFSARGSFIRPGLPAISRFPPLDMWPCRALPPCTLPGVPALRKEISDDYQYRRPRSAVSRARAQAAFGLSPGQSAAIGISSPANMRDVRTSLIKVWTSDSAE